MKRTTEFRAMPKANYTNTAHKKWGKNQRKWQNLFSCSFLCHSLLSGESPCDLNNNISFATVAILTFFSGAVLRFPQFFYFEDRVVFQMQYC